MLSYTMENYTSKLPNFTIIFLNSYGYEFSDIGELNEAYAVAIMFLDSSKLDNETTLKYFEQVRDKYEKLKAILAEI